MKKVLFLISKVKRDGPNRVLENMVKGLHKNEYEIFVLSFLKGSDIESVKLLENYGAKVISLDLEKKIDILKKGSRLVGKIIADNNIEIIHSHGILPDIAAAKIKNKKIKKFTTIHNNIYEDYKYTFGKKGFLIAKWHIHYLKKFNKCICCSKSSYEHIKGTLNNVTYVQNSIYDGKELPNNYQEIREKIRLENNIPLDASVYVYIGALNSRKNVINLAKNFFEKTSENQYLLIVGDGPLKEELQQKYNSNRIILCGFHMNVQDYLMASDIYYSSSLSEGFSISVLEALEYNNYLLLSDIPSHKEIFEIDESNYIGEYFSDKNFKDKINNIEKKLVEKNENKIFEFLSNNLSCEVMMKKYTDVYNEVK